MARIHAASNRSEPAPLGADRVVAPDANELHQSDATPPEGTGSAMQDTPACDDRTSGLIFEMANVLYDATLWWRWFAGLLGRLRPEIEIAPLDQAWTSEYLPQIRCGRREFGEALDSFLHHAGFARGEIDEVLAAGLTRRRDLEFEVLPFPGVKRTLCRLRDTGLRLAIVSDSANTSGELRDRLHRLGLGRLFEVVISSIEMEQTKPAQVCYEAAIERLALPKSQLWFVGQSASDLAGAARAGLRTIAVQPEAAAAADRTIDRFSALVDVVAGKRASPAPRIGRSVTLLAP